MSNTSTGRADGTGVHRLAGGDWRLVAVGAVAVGVIVGVISFLVPANYQASSVVSIQTVGTSSTTSLSQSVEAANDLASQYAQLVNNSSEGAGGLSVGGDAEVSASVIANQNLVKLTSQTDSSDQAIAVAKSASKEMVAAVQDQQEQAQQQAERNVKNLTSAIDDQIEAARTRADRTARQAQRANAQPGSALLLTLSNQNDQISNLLNQRAAIQSQAASGGSAEGVTAEVVSSPSSAGRVGPRPWLNIPVGLVAGGLVTWLILRRRHSPES